MVGVAPTSAEPEELHIEERSVATTVAALRWFQQSRSMAMCDDAIADRATDYGNRQPLSDAEIDAEVERLLTS